MKNVNENREIAIKLSGVKKKYRLGQIGGTTLRADLQSWWAKIRKKEDPNVRIGVDQRLIGQEFMALNGIDLTIYQGEAIGIIGSNGAGKSTMLKLLSRVTAPTEGEIDINGRITSMLEVGTGFNGEMTGRENVYLNGAILGMTKAEIDAKMEDIIEFSEVRDFIDTPVKRYSSGMYVKLAFSVAAHLDSEIMIMDEVLAVGDMAFQKKCLGKMREAAKQQGRTVLYVSHNMNTIRQLCDRCVVLNQGRVVFIGDVEEAIGIYLGDRSGSPTHINLESLPRTEKIKGGIKMICAECISGKNWHITVGNKLRFSFSVKAQRNMENVGVRFRLFTPSGQSIAMSACAHLFTGLANQTMTATLEMDTSFIVPGRYFISPVLYSANEFGANEVYDFIHAAIVLEVENKSRFNENIPWNIHAWGNIRLPEVAILGLKNEEI